jgi:hypothetical protein
MRSVPQKSLSATFFDRSRNHDFVNSRKIPMNSKANTFDGLRDGAAHPKEKID